MVLANRSSHRLLVILFGNEETSSTNPLEVMSRGEIFSVSPGHAFHFGLIYWIKSSYNVVRIIHNSISENRNALNKTIYRYDVTRYCGRDDVIHCGDRYDVTRLSSRGAC